MSLTPMKYLSCCSGIEAASVAWEPLGWKPVGFSEIEPYPSAVLKHRFPTTPNYGDLTKYNDWPISAGDVDLIIAGTPCQSFSVAGLRKGLADPRGNLALTILGLVDKLQPKYFLWENVPGVLSSGEPKGSDFGAFLGALVQLGYGFAYRVLDAQFVGRCPVHASGTGWETVPQRRRRVFVLAVKGPGGAATAAKILFEPSCVRRDTPKGRPTRKGSPAGPQASAGGDGRQWPADTACTLNASFGSKLGLEDQHALGGGSLFVMSSGQANAAIAEDKAHTLNATHETQTLVQTPIVIDRAAFNQGENAQYEPHIGESEVMDSLVARGPHAVGVPLMFKVRGGSPTETGEQGGTPGRVAGKGFLGSEDKTFTITAVQDQWLAQPVIAPTVTTCKGSRGGSSSEAIDELIALHRAQEAIPLDSMNLLSRLGPGGENHSLQDFVPGDPMFTITKAQHHGVAQPIPIQDGRDIEKHQNGLGVGQEGDPAYTVDTTGAQAAAVPLMNNEPHIVQASELRLSGKITEQQVCPTLTAGAKQGDTEPLAVVHCSDIAPTVTSSGPPYSRTGNERVEADALVTHPIAFQPGNLARKAGASPSTEAFPTLTKDSGDQSPHVCAPTLTASNDPSRSPQSSEVTQQVAAVHQVTMAVRRLVPEECEALQGFPRGWTRIPWKGKSEADAPDGPRYKACGNSMATPVIRWIGSRIQAFEDGTLDQ